jgi:hypothetical protein
MTTTTATPVDREVLAVLTALRPLLGDSRLERHLRLDQREFDAQGALDEGTWSSGEAALIRWAGALWSGVGDVALGYCANHLSGRFLDAALGSLAAYRGEALPAYGADGVRR